MFGFKNGVKDGVETIYATNDLIPVTNYYVKGELVSKESYDLLQKGFDIVCESIGKSKSTLEKIESSNHKPYMEYYTNQEVINYVEDKYGNIY